MVKQQAVEGANGQIINITSISRSSSWIVDPIAESVDVYHYDVGANQPSTKIDLREIKNKIPIVPTIGNVSIVDYVFPEEAQAKEAFYFESETWQTAFRNIDNYVYWLWGSKENGGCLIWRDSGSIYIDVIRGFYSYETVELGERFYYLRNPQRTDPTSDEMWMFFVLDQQDLSANNIYVTFHSLDDATTWDLYQTIWAIDPPVADDVTVQSPLIEDTRNLANCLSYVGVSKNKIGQDTYEYGIGGNIGLQPVNPSMQHESTLVSGNLWGNVEIDAGDNPFLPSDFASEAGGWGSYPMQSDSIDFTDVDNFTVDVLNSGFVTLYNPTIQNMVDFNRFLFSGLTDSIVTNLKKLVTNPLEYVLFIAMTHFKPETNVSDEISFAGVGSNVYAPKLLKQFKQIKCGAITIPEASKSFLDYGSYSKCSIFLPYIGQEELAIDDVMGSRVELSYNIDYLSGSCLAQIKCTRSSRSSADPSINSVLYEFTGNIYTIIPLSATDWRGAISSAIGLIGGVSSGVISAATGNPLGAIQEIGGSVADAVMSNKVSVHRTGSPASSYGYMDIQNAYLILERPNQSIPANYGKYQGYTSNIYKRIGDLRGYTEINTDNIYIDNYKGITEEEFEELKDILNGGIYL